MHINTYDDKDLTKIENVLNFLGVLFNVYWIYYLYNKSEGRESFQDSELQTTSFRYLTVR